MKEFTAKEAREEANMRNDIGKLKEEIYERIYCAATKGKYGTSYQPQHMEITMPIYYLMLAEFGSKGYKIAWSDHQNRLIIMW